MRLSVVAALVGPALISGLLLTSTAQAKAAGEGASRQAATRKARRSGDAPNVPQASNAAKPSQSDKPSAEARADDAAPAPRGPARIDFDDRLIQGQSNKSGAVYLFDRKELVIRSMVQQRTSYRQQIVQDVLAE